MRTTIINRQHRGQGVGNQIGGLAGLARQGLCDAGGGNARLLQSAEDEIRQGSKHPLHRGVGITAAKACQRFPDALYQAGAEQGVKHPLGGGASQQAR